MKKLLVLVGIIAFAFAYGWTRRPITYPPGVLIQGEPVQTGFAPQTPAFAFHEFSLKPLARFEADLRVLHSKIYRYDRQSALVPVDLAVGWGPMSDQTVLDQLEISQSMRFFWYEYQMPPPIPVDQIICHATNMHIIPATAELAAAAKALRSGTLIHVRGQLVEATGGRIGTWRSSLSRTDCGNGACELLYLEELSPMTADPLTSARLVKRR